MKIGIDGSRAFLAQRTGIEEYSYQVIKNLRNNLKEGEIFLYVRKNQKVDFPLPENWQIRTIGWFRFWTQGGLSWEMLFRPVEVLFIPAHTVPFIHPDKTIVTVHGLEYEMMPEAYSFWERLYMRFSIKNSCHWATTIISVSRNTRRDLISLYGVPENKIQVIYEGYDDKNQNLELNLQNPFGKYEPYFLFIGRLEVRKNLVGIISAFEILKERYGFPHKLLLAGRPGYGYEKIRDAINKAKSRKNIVELGFIRDEDKFLLLGRAKVFLFPTFYEGFGIPILEAQSVGTPVVTSNVSSMPEVAGEAAILVDPSEPSYMAERIRELILDKGRRDDIIKKGYENIRRFSWQECAQNISMIIKK